jgi:hypothetical protein
VAGGLSRGTGGGGVALRGWLVGKEEPTRGGVPSAVKRILFYYFSFWWKRQAAGVDGSARPAAGEMDGDVGPTQPVPCGNGNGKKHHLTEMRGLPLLPVPCGRRWRPRRDTRGMRTVSRCHVTPNLE